MGWYQWIFTEGHMDCAWRLAERTATLMGADQVRLDIFLARNHPGECSLNENSISSGPPYGAHGEHLANIWYEPYDNHLRIYEQTAANLPKAAAERAAKLAENIHGKKGRGSSPQEINTRVKAHHDTVSVKQNFPKSVVGEGDEVTVVTTVTHSTSAAQKKK